MKTSCIIPTLNRPDDLRRALASIVANTKQPDEVIIVEQGDVDATLRVSGAFVQLNICVLFQEERSLTKARNRGVAESAGDLLLFLDDDVEVGPRYIENVRKYFLAHPDVLGITGKDTGHVSTRAGVVRFVRRSVGVLFCRSAFFGVSRILRSGHNVLQNYRDREEVVEWLPGCASSWRADVFKEGLRFDERLIGWCFGEDVMFSYAVHKKYPGSLRYVPQVRFTHNASLASRTPNEQKIRMETLYRFLFWKEHVYDGSFLNTCCYVWSQVGAVVVTFASAPHATVLRTLAQTYQFVFRYGHTANSDAMRYNNFITYEKT